MYDFRFIAYCGYDFSIFTFSSYLFFSGKFVIVVFLIILFSVIMITRNILEPKLLSASLELSQLSVLIAIFVGLNAGGFKGMIYLIALFIAFNFYKKYIIYEEKDLNCNSKIKKRK